MRGKRRGENDRAQSKQNTLKEFWSRRPLSMWPKSSVNKVLARRLERRRKNRDVDLEDDE